MSRDDLRADCIDILAGYGGCIGFEDAAVIVDTILIEIERDCVILPRDRAERLRDTAGCAEYEGRLHDGDLDPFGEAAS